MNLRTQLTVGGELVKNFLLIGKQNSNLETLVNSTWPECVQLMCSESEFGTNITPGALEFFIQIISAQMIEPLRICCPEDIFDIVRVMCRSKNLACWSNSFSEDE